MVCQHGFLPVSDNGAKAVMFRVESGGKEFSVILSCFGVVRVEKVNSIEPSPLRAGSSRSRGFPLLRKLKVISFMCLLKSKSMLLLILRCCL